MTTAPRKDIGMIRIITIEREYECGGGEIAQLLAKQLGWKLWDQLLTAEIARLAHCPKAIIEAREERQDPLYYRLFKSFLRGSYEGSINAPKLNLVDSETILESPSPSWNMRQRKDTASLWAEDHNIFLGIARTPCEYFSTLHETRRCNACYRATRPSKRPKSLWIPWTGSAPISFGDISTWSGRIMRFITR